MDVGLTRASGCSSGGGLQVLLSAYACEPHQGSEPGVGWHWATGLARAGHRVCVVTRANNRGAIEKALGETALPGLRFVYYDLPRWARWWKRGGRGVRLYYLLWQWGAYRLARRLCRGTRFDVVHHITFGVFRHPSFMAFLGVPFVFGPVGGGEAAPFALRRSYPLRGWIADLLRDAANRCARIDPLMNAVFRRSAAVLCKTSETLRCVPRRFRDRCVVGVELGTEEAHAPPPCGARDPRSFRVLYVGRLLHWKGLHLGLAAFARLRAAHPAAQLTVIGSGPAERRLRDLAGRFGIDASVTWVPWVERAAVMRAYLEHDAFLFPSLHDSSGNVVLEALSCGLPVVCLDLGGPAVLVDASCGFRVPAAGPDQTVAGLAQALVALASDTELAQRMADGATRRAHHHFSWDRQVARMERLYRAVIAASGGPAGAQEQAS